MDAPQKPGMRSWVKEDAWLESVDAVLGVHAQQVEEVRRLLPSDLRREHRL